MSPGGPGGAAAPPAELAGRFELLGRVGGGGMGEVFRARDRSRQREIALKVLRGADPGALLRFKQEFRALVDVAHPNLVEYYELLAHGEQWLLAMEYIDGVDVLSWVRRGFGGDPAGAAPAASARPAARPDGEPAAADPLGDDWQETKEEDTAVRSGAGGARAAHGLSHPSQYQRLRAAMRQLAQGVLALHDAGHLHRDLKPTNVMVGRDERLVVLDFGVVTDLARRDDPGQIVGTPAYMAPEQSAGKALSDKSDWYSVGVILYEALTGRRPFGGSVRHSLEARTRFDPSSPRRLVPTTPADLDDLCMALLQRRPEERPDGRELLRRLGVSPPPRLVVAGGPDLLVGRDPHLAALRKAFDDAARGDSHALLVRGATGMGKTALVQRFLAEVRHEHRAVVLTGRCYERESMPYKALDPVIDSLCRHLLTLRLGDLQAILPADLGPLVRLFPVLRRVEAAVGAPDPGPPPPPVELRRRALEALRELVARMSALTPVVIHIDDLQWGDTDSAVVIQELLRPPQAPRMLFIAGFRAEDARTSPFLRALLPLAAVPVEIEVAPLTRAESLHLAFRLLGPIAESLPAVCNSIARESGGNPFFLHELVQYVRSSATGDVSLGTISLEDVIRTRLAELPADARRLLDVVALAGQPISSPAARRASELGEEYDGAVHLLRVRKLIRARAGDERGAGAMEPYHDRIREVAVAVMADDLRRDLHRALAVALSVEAEPDPESLADHFEAAGDSERAAQLLISAAEHASRALAFDRASGLYQRALTLRSFPAAEEIRLRAGLARALGNAARGAEAAAAYLDAARSAPPVEAIEYRRMAAEHLLHVGHVDEGLDLLEQVARAVGLRIPRSRAGSLLSFLWHRARLRVRRLRNYRLRDPAEIAPTVLRRLDVCWSASIGLAMVDPVSGVDFQTKHLLLCLKAGEPYRLARALALEFAYLCTTGVRARPRCDQLGKLVLELADKVDAPELRGWYHAVHGLAHYQWGEFAEAQGHAREAAEILRNTAGLVFERTSNELYGLWSMYYLGEAGELARRVRRHLRDAEDRGDRYTRANLSTGLCQLAWLVHDDLDGARDASEQALQSWSHRAYHLQHYWHFIGRLQAALYAGEPAQVWAIYQEGWPGYQKSLFPRIEIVANEADSFAARAHLVASRADGADADGRLKSADRIADGMIKRGPAYGRAMGILVRAGVAARRGQTEDALALLGHAEAGFEATHMRLHRATCRWRRGQLIGGADGDALIAEARAEMDAQGIVRPDRMADLFGPGFD